MKFIGFSLVLLFFAHHLFSQQQIILSICKDTDKPVKGLIVILDEFDRFEDRTDNYFYYVFLDPTTFMLFKTYLLNSDVKRNLKNPYFNECHLLNAIIIDNQPRSFKMNSEKLTKKFLMSFIDICKQYALNDDLKKGFEDMLIAIIGYDSFREMYLF
jgi:hypothetical protein